MALSHRGATRTRARVLGALLSLGLLLSWSCAKNPVTGREELSLISEEKEIELGRQAAEEARASIGLVDDSALQAYVRRVGMKIARDSERPNLPWSFQVLDDPTPNAFALPGGYIFVTRGMLGVMDSEAELASVLGHEIGHVTARHSVQQISRAEVAQIGLGVGSILFPEIQGISGILGTSLQLMLLQYSRDAEQEADDLGFRYALSEGYDVREMDDVFQTLDRIQKESGRSPLPTWASTHPTPGSRVEAIQQRIAQVSGDLDRLEVGREPFMSEIDGLVYGDDPREGFFEDGMFYQPDLGFQVAMPSGWQAQNLPNVVYAVSGQQDAIVQLGMASGTPETAARQFLGVSGVRGGEVANATIHGMPAVLANFQAQTDQGVIQGIAAFVAHRGDTYAILGYTPAGRYNRYANVFERTIESFAPVTDRSVLAVQPERIDVVELPRAMRVSEFARQYPSDIDLQELLLINQLPNANATMPAGRPFKRVIRSSRTTASVTPAAR